MRVIFHEKLREAEAKARQVPGGREDQGTASVSQSYVLTLYTAVCRPCLVGVCVCLVCRHLQEETPSLSAAAKKKKQVPFT